MALDCISTRGESFCLFRGDDRVSMMSNSSSAGSCLAYFLRFRPFAGGVPSFGPARAVEIDSCLEGRDDSDALDLLRLAKPMKENEHLACRPQNL